MKKYVTPTAEKVEFNYNEQIVASGALCIEYWTKMAGTDCIEEHHQASTK